MGSPQWAASTIAALQPMTVIGCMWEWTMSRDMPARLPSRSAVPVRHVAPLRSHKELGGPRDVAAPVALLPLLNDLAAVPGREPHRRPDARHAPVGADPTPG